MQREATRKRQAITEDTAAFLLPHDPVARKRANKRGIAEVSSVSTTTVKSGIGKTGVSLRFHKKKEYDKLTPEQKLELKQWREAQSKGSDTPQEKKKPKLQRKRERRKQKKG